jgi:hypothetical protein
MTPATREYLLDYWGAGFPPKPYSRTLATFWPWETIIGLLGPGGQASLAYPLPTLYALLAVGGIGILWRRERRAAILLTAPFALTGCAAFARQYPFTGRLILFLVPAVFIAIATAVEGIRRLAHPYSPALAGTLVLCFLGGVSGCCHAYQCGLDAERMLWVDATEAIPGGISRSWIPSEAALGWGC